MKKISIVDVAKEAGVSIATVSRALNENTELVAPKTRDKIRRIAEEMQFELSERRASATPRTPRKKKATFPFWFCLTPSTRK